MKLVIFGLGIYDVIVQVVNDRGEEVLGNLSLYGMEEKLNRYLNGIFSVEADGFYRSFSHYFLGSFEDEKLRSMRRKFDIEVSKRKIRDSKF